jgi:hypothetical protein
MRKLAVSITLFVLSCGGGDDLSPGEACNQAMAIVCDKWFACYTKEILEANKTIFGLNAADCKVKYQGSECNAEKVRCDLGTTFNSANASMCVAGYRQMSCNDIMANPPVEPAACDRVCI